MQDYIQKMQMQCRAIMTHLLLSAGAPHSLFSEQPSRNATAGHIETAHIYEYYVMHIHVHVTWA